MCVPQTSILVNILVFQHGLLPVIKELWGFPTTHGGETRAGICYPLRLHIWSLSLELLVTLHLAAVPKVHTTLSALGQVRPAGCLVLTLVPTPRSRDCSSLCTLISSLEFYEDNVSSQELVCVPRAGMPHSLFLLL